MTLLRNFVTYERDLMVSNKSCMCDHTIKIKIQRQRNFSWSEYGHKPRAVCVLGDKKYLNYFCMSLQRLYRVDELMLFCFFRWIFEITFGVKAV